MFVFFYSYILNGPRMHFSPKLDFCLTRRSIAMIQLDRCHQGKYLPSFSHPQSSPNIRTKCQLLKLMDTIIIICTDRYNQQEIVCDMIWSVLDSAS